MDTFFTCLASLAIQIQSLTGTPISSVKGYPLDFNVPLLAHVKEIKWGYLKVEDILRSLR